MSIELFNEELIDYCTNLSSTPEADILLQIERQTQLKTLAPRMLSGALQASFLTFISKMKSPAFILEIGTFTGYSAIALAHGLAPGGKLVTIEHDEEHAALAKQHILLSKFAEKIQLITGDAKKIVPTLNDSFDLVFIDADKEGYSLYFDLVIEKCAPGAIIMADNVLWSGKVTDKIKDKKTKIIHDFNEKIKNDPRVENFLLPMRDGINLIRKI